MNKRKITTEIKIIKKNQTKFLESKNIITKLKILFKIKQTWSNRGNNLDLEERALEISSHKSKKKKKWNKERLESLWDTIK